MVRLRKLHRYHEVRNQVKHGNDFEKVLVDSSEMLTDLCILVTSFQREPFMKRLEIQSWLDLLIKYGSLQIADSLFSYY